MNMDWNHPDVYQYEKKIPLKIPCYEMLYDMMDRLLTVRLSEDAANVMVVGAGGGQELVTLAKDTRIGHLQESIRLPACSVWREKGWSSPEFSLKPI